MGDRRNAHMDLAFRQLKFDWRGKSDKIKIFVKVKVSEIN